MAMGEVGANSRSHKRIMTFENKGDKLGLLPILHDHWFIWINLVLQKTQHSKMKSHSKHVFLICKKQRKYIMSHEAYGAQKNHPAADVCPSVLKTCPSLQTTSAARHFAPPTLESCKLNDRPFWARKLWRPQSRYMHKNNAIHMYVLCDFFLLCVCVCVCMLVGHLWASSPVEWNIFLYNSHHLYQ